MIWSPLAQGRGLKRAKEELCQDVMTSPLAQGRGLKLVSAAMINLVNRSPLAQGRGLKPSMFVTSITEGCRPSRRGVD